MGIQWSSETRNALSHMLNFLRTLTPREMIGNVIYAVIPDPDVDPEFYYLVI